MRKVKGVLQRDKEERNLLHTVKGRKGNWIGHMFHTNCRLENIIQEKIKSARRRGRRRKQLLHDLEGNEKILEFERSSTRSHCVENWLWKRLWTCRKRDCVLIRLTHQRIRRRNQK